MKAFLTHFSTSLMVLLSLSTIGLSIVSSQESHLNEPNPCSPNQKGTVYPVEGKCTSFVYCQDGSPLELPCPLGNGFSMAAKGCVNMKKSDCALEKPTSTVPDECNKNEPNPVNKAQCTDQPADARRPYVGDCMKFLICDCEYPTIMSCSNGLWFNPKTKVCDSPKNVDCPWASSTTTSMTTILTTEVDSTSDTADTTTESIEIATSIVSSSTGSIESKCLNQSNNSIIPYYENCTQFILCYDDIPALHSCPKGFIFDVELLICTQEDSDDNDVDDDDINCNSVTTTEATPRDICTYHEAGSVLPNDESCDSYIFCNENGQEMILKCPVNHYFNPITGICGSSTSPTLCKEKKFFHHQICSNSTINGQIEAHPFNCRKYISCVLPAPIAFDCLSNETFNPNTLRCETTIDDSYKLKTKTTKNSPSFNICEGIEDNDTLPYAENRQFNIRCHGSSFMLESCNIHEFYDPRSRNCRVVLPEELTDYEISTEGIPASSITESTLNNEIEISTSFDESQETISISDQITNEVTTAVPNEKSERSIFISTTTSTATTETQTTNIISLLCYDVMERGLVPHPNSCNMFIICNPSKPVIHICPTGLEFNAQILACVDPDVSGCKKGNKESIFQKDFEGNICCDKPLNTQLPYPNDNSRFILCQYPLPLTYYCPLGTIYNAKNEHCSVDTSDSSWYDIITIAPETIQINTNDSISTIDPWSDSYATHKMDFNSELYESSLDSSTETISSSSSIEATTTLKYELKTKNVDIATICMDQTYGSQFPFIGNCTKYYFCLKNGGGEIFECISGWYFDPKKRICVSPNSYHCPWCFQRVFI